MADPRFFNRAGPFTLQQLVEIGQGALSEKSDPQRLFHDVATLESATADQLSFFDNKKYIDAFLVSNAGACVVTPEFASKAPPAMELIISKNPYKSYARIAQAFYPMAKPVGSIHKSAVIDASAKIGSDVAIGANAVIGRNVEIGAGTQIEENVVIKDGVQIGAQTIVGANATLSHCVIGSNVVIYPGVRIGQSGFGFAPDPVVPVKVPQLGRVIIEDNVEVGANSTIDRGAINDTVIGPGTMIDNLVQIGHNVRIGRGCVIVSQVGISGSTVLEDYVQLGGQAGLAGHLHIGRGARVAAKSGVMRDIEPGGIVGGIPAVPVKQWHRQSAALGNLARLKKTASDS